MEQKVCSIKNSRINYLMGCSENRAFFDRKFKIVRIGLFRQLQCIWKLNIYDIVVQQRKPSHAFS